MKQSSEKIKAITYEEMMSKYGEPLNHIDALYCRLSKEDVKKKDESNSITNQKIVLEKHAQSLGLKNPVFFIDDGVSGKFIDIRDSFQTMLELVEQGKVKTVVVKDLWRLGRNYREMGEVTEQLFPHYGVRFISIANGLDKTNEHNPHNLNGGMDMSIAVQNLMGEYYLQNLSNSRRLGNIGKDSQGYAIGKPPYGYKRSEANPKLWEVDEEAAEVVKEIYSLRLKGYSAEAIGDILRSRQIVIPTLYMERKGYSKPSTRPFRGDYFWNTNTVVNILKNQSYLGDVVNFKTYTLSYKDRQSRKTPKEKQKVHIGVHQPIIEREVWEQVQKTFRQNMGSSKAKKAEKHLLAGYLVCTDCGANLNHKHMTDKPQNSYFSCANYRRSKLLCTSSHHIRVDHITRLVTWELDNIVRFARDFEDEFVKIVIDERYKHIRLKQNKNKRDLQTLLARVGELNKITMSLYEDKVKGIISDDTFVMMSKNYEDEKLEVSTKAKHLQKVVDSEELHVMNVDQFLEEVRVYTKINELTPEILRTFIDRIVVHHRLEDKDTRTQEVEIFYNFIGQVQTPDVEEKQRYKKSFARVPSIKKENHTALAV